MQSGWCILKGGYVRIAVHSCIMKIKTKTKLKQMRTNEIYAILTKKKKINTMKLELNDPV